MSFIIIKSGKIDNIFILLLPDLFLLLLLVNFLFVGAILALSLSCFPVICVPRDVCDQKNIKRAYDERVG